MADAHSITNALGGRWHSGRGAAPCPCCQPERRRDQRALSLADGDGGKLVLHCFKSGCAFSDILAAAGVGCGSHQRHPQPAPFVKREGEQHAERAERGRRAMEIWNEAEAISATHAETYLRGRGISCDLPRTLRFHPACWHASTARRHPAMVALVEGGEGFAVHRTYLSPHGTGKAAIEPNKMMLGAVAGGAVRLSEGEDRLVVAEGIETALSLASGLLHTAATVWAALSTSGMTALRLPDEPAQLTIAPDGDKAGHSAAMTLADRAARDGWSVSILTPPEGGDFNDLWRREVKT